MAEPDLSETQTGSRPDPLDLGFAVAAIAAFVLLLTLGAGMTFYSDEWAFVLTRTLTNPLSWLPPHNEHWSTVAIVLYRVLVETVGLRTYVPYLAVLAVLHILVAALVYTHVRRTSGPWPALGVAVIVLLLGSGLENLYWAFQFGFVMSVAAGLGAMLAFEAPIRRRRIILGTLLLLVSLASSGMGLVFAAVVAIELALDRRRRFLLATLNVPAAAYAIWYLTFGRFGLGTQRDPLTLQALADVPRFIVDGLADAGGAVSGLSRSFGLIAIGAIALVALFKWRSAPGKAPAPRFIACILGVVLMYGLIGSVRAQLFAGSDMFPRYTYVASVLLFIAVASVVGRIAWPAPGRERLAALAVAGSMFAVSLSWNVQLLIGGRGVFLERADWARALVIVTTDPAFGRRVDPNGFLPAAIASYGSPLSDVLVPWAVRTVPDVDIAEARRQLGTGATWLPTQ